MGPASATQPLGGQALLRTAATSSDTGPYSEFNGALTQFYNAYDVLLYASENGEKLDTTSADYIENNALNHALTLGSPTDAASISTTFGSTTFSNSTASSPVAAG